MSFRGRDMRRGGSFSGGRGRDNYGREDARNRDQPARSAVGASGSGSFNRGPSGPPPSQNRSQPNGQAAEAQTGAAPQPASQPSSKVEVNVESAAAAASQSQAQPTKNATAAAAPSSRADAAGEANAIAAKGQGDQINKTEKKFTGRCRLFVGNLPSDMSDDQFGTMFKEFGEITEVFLNAKKGFGFVKMETRAVAEAAKGSLDGKTMRGRQIRVRFATHGAALRVKNLPSVCSNELLADAFSQFGEVERAVVIVDDKGKSSGEGIVEFARKPSCNKALSAVSEGVFMLTRTPRPILVELLEQKDDEDGLPEKYVPKNNEYQSEMEEKPRFAAIGSFEHEFGQRWKRLDVLEREKLEQVRREMKEARENLEMEMESALHEYKADLLRQDLMRRQAELDRMDAEKQKREMMKRRDMEVRRQQPPQSMHSQSRHDDSSQMRSQQDDMMRRSGQFSSSQQFGPPQGQSSFGGPGMSLGGPGMGGANYGSGSSRDDGPTNPMLPQQSPAGQRDTPGNQRGPIGLPSMQQPPLGNINYNQSGGPMSQGMQQDYGGRMAPPGNMARFDQAAPPNFNSQGPVVRGPSMGGPQQPMGSGAGSASGPAPFPNMPGIAPASMMQPRDDQFGDPKRRRFH